MTHVPASSHDTTFNGGTITGALTVAPTAGGLDAFTIYADPTDTVNTTFIVDRHGNLFMASGGSFQECFIDLLDNTSGNPGHIRIDTYTGLLLNPEGSSNTIARIEPRSTHSGLLFDVRLPTGAKAFRIPVGGGIDANPIASGALPTVAPVSGTAFQCSTVRDVFLTVPVTYNPGVATTATCKVELSPDNVTYSTLITITQPVGTVFDGSIEPMQLAVPAGWFVKLTVVNATLGTGTYY